MKQVLIILSSADRFHLSFMHQNVKKKKINLFLELFLFIILLIILLFINYITRIHELAPI